MKINKDLVDAVMMLSFIALVLAGTSETAEQTRKTIIMGTLIVVALGMILLRILGNRRR